MKLGFVVIYVEDVKGLLEFYQKAFDLKVRFEYEEGGVLLYGEMETEGAVLGFASHEMGKMNLGVDYQKTSLNEKPFGQEIVFVTDDVQGAYEKAIKSGATSVAEPLRKPWGQTVAFIRDIEGGLIELCTPMNE
ncbi:VOC family protein [Aliikangiella coralliicola]|uniref:VOC family protein n=1 Tax=Aliikangiella coralliicola TaxID=2592383 RepID=A0A545UFG8_9GAMM|nr:VOC family protein [Aliikangiella coralliicola]TQV88221.1 VOC family protein [Aliikangiella coralliicola]